MSQVFDLSSGAEFADVFFGGFGCNVETLGDGKICAAVELGWKAVEEGLTEDCDSASSGVGVG